MTRRKRAAVVPRPTRLRATRERGPGTGDGALRRATPLPDQVVAALRRRISTGELAPGRRLPTEKELSEIYGVSRPIIREAVGRLKHDGLVTSRQGSGAFVAEPGAASAFRIDVHDLEDAGEMRNIIELLVAVEVAVAEKAAVRRSAQQLAEIRKALQQIEECAGAGRDGVEEDMQFHRRIAEAAGNPFFIELNDFLDARVRKFIRIARANTARTRGLWTVVQGEHAAIHDAIAKRDPAAARRASEEHLRNAAQRLALYRRA